MPRDGSNIVIMNDVLAPAITILVHVDSNRSLPLLDGSGDIANLIHEIAAMRSEAEAADFFKRIDRMVV